MERIESTWLPLRPGGIEGDEMIRKLLCTICAVICIAITICNTGDVVWDRIAIANGFSALIQILWLIEEKSK
jgi:hypothetical protein